MKDEIFSGDETARRTAAEVPLADRRILLWDIDGTLLRSSGRGAYRDYFSATMRRVFGHPGELDAIVPSGMTDTQIICEALRPAGFTPETIFARLPELVRVFEEEMREAVESESEPFYRLPGAAEILRATARRPIFVNALLTGNLSVAAVVKLRAVGLWDYFAGAPNAFGEISNDRRALAHAAGRMFNEHYGFDFRPAQFIVIGDTPNDIACARDFGAKVVAVKTGRGQSAELLAECRPDALLDDLAETETVLELLERI